MAPRRLTRTLLDRWHRENGYRQVLAIAFPLILSTGSWSVKLFVDRMLLTWYSPEAVAASMPAGILNFALMSIFIGTAGYTNTFVAQYYGAGRYGRIGPAVWQGFYVALIGGVVLLALIPLAEPFFTFVGHDPAVREYETVYFRILCIGATPAIASAAMAGFFSGRGKTWPVMWVNVFGAAVNLVMDYALIFGNWGFPELGIRGAAIATVASSSVQLLAYIVLTFFVHLFTTRLEIPSCLPHPATNRRAKIRIRLIQMPYERHPQRRNKFQPIIIGKVLYFSLP